MKVSVLRGLKSSLLLFLWLVLVQMIACLLSVVITLILGLSHPVGPTPLWQWILNGVLTCLLWLLMGRVTPYVVQPRPVGAVAVLTIWTILTSLMRNMYLLFLPQRICGGMLRQILQILYDDSSVRLDEYWDWPIGCFLLSAAFGVGLLLRRKHTKAIHNTSG